jgi:hypothetical protein
MFLGAASTLENNRAVFGGGSLSSIKYNIMDYVTISSTGNAADFGDLIYQIEKLKATSNGTSGTGGWAGGSAITTRAEIETVNLSSLGNASSNGTLQSARQLLAATSNSEGDRGLVGGGLSLLNIIEYWTISTGTTSVDFGDLTVGRRDLCALSNG